MSKEVILRRLVIFELASRKYYERKHNEWEARIIRQQERGGGGKRNRAKECISKNGTPFVSLVLESYRKEKITRSDIADYLDIRLKYVPQVELLLEAGV